MFVQASRPIQLEIDYVDNERRRSARQPSEHYATAFAFPPRILHNSPGIRLDYVNEPCYFFSQRVNRFEGNLCL